MKKYWWKILVVCLVCVLAMGCVLSVGSKRKLNVTWHIVEKEVATQIVERGVTTVEIVKKEEIGASKRYYGWVGSGIEIRADMGGDTRGEFKFQLTSDIPSEQIANNIIKIKPDKPERGSLSVSKEGQEVIVEYEIFPSGILYPHSIYPEIPVGFDFKNGTRRNYYTDSMYMQGLSMEVHGLVAVVDQERGGEEWLHDFAEINNLHEYEYEEMTFEPEYRKIYLIKCKDGGYAAVQSISSGWGFIYKYSETGIFE